MPECIGGSHPAQQLRKQSTTMTEIQRDKNSFFGLSSLREKEKVAQGRSEKAQELDNYLSSKYASSGLLKGSACQLVRESVYICKYARLYLNAMGSTTPLRDEQYVGLVAGAEGGQKKKKKKKHGSTAQPGVRIHDLDNTGFHDVSKASGVPHARNRGRMPLGEEEEEEGKHTACKNGFMLQWGCDSHKQVPDTLPGADAPVVANPGEALRLQQVAARVRSPLVAI